MANAELQAPLGLDQKAVIPAQKGIDNSDASSEEDAAAIRERTIQQRLENTQALVLPIMTLFGRREDGKDLDQTATQPSVYDDPSVAKYFAPSEKYENLHRFDPEARWTWREELPLINKIDWRITLWACIAFFGLDLDRANLSQANTDNFLPDLGLDTNDFNLGNTVFRLAFLCSELPSQLVSKKLGPDRWIPTIMCLWSIVAASQFWLSGRASFLVCRALLGALQGGFIPDVILYLSYLFKGTELSFRLALFWTSLRVTDIIAPILALGLLKLRGFHGYEGWRWLFLFEGILTLTIGIWSWFMMVPRLCTSSIFVQVSGIAYSNVYQAKDRPLYRKGNRILVGINVLNIFLYLFVKAYYIWRNKKRDKQWNALSKEEQVNYLATTNDSGSKRKDFRFAH